MEHYVKMALKTALHIHNVYSLIRIKSRLAAEILNRFLSDIVDYSSKSKYDIVWHPNLTLRLKNQSTASNGAMTSVYENR